MPRCSGTFGQHVVCRSCRGAAAPPCTCLERGAAICLAPGIARVHCMEAHWPGWPAASAECGRSKSVCPAAMVLRKAESVAQGFVDCISLASASWQQLPLPGDSVPLLPGTRDTKTQKAATTAKCKTSTGLHSGQSDRHSKELSLPRWLPMRASAVRGSISSLGNFWQNAFKGAEVLSSSDCLRYSNDWCA